MAVALSAQATMENSCQGMMAFMPVYFPASPYMNAPYEAFDGEACASSPPESVPERVSDAPSEGDAVMQQILEKTVESSSWYPYQEGFWLRAGRLRLLDDRRWKGATTVDVIVG